MNDKITGVVKMFKEMTRDQLEAYKYMTIFFIIADLFIMYWYFQLKQLGLALLLVAVSFLALFLILERRLQDTMPEEEQKTEEKPKEEKKEDKPEEKKDDKEEKEEPKGLEMDFELPSAEEYEKRIEKAIG